MVIYIFSDSTSAGRCFTKITNKNGITFKVSPLDKLKKTILDLQKDSISYIDISSYNEKDLLKLLNFLRKLSGPHYGIIDPKGMIDDAAALFHKGAIDYIGKKLYTKGISPVRMKEIIRIYCPTSIINAVKPAEISNRFIPSCNDWNSIEAGREYTFCFMFIELDNKTGLKKKHFGADAKYDPEQFFRKFVQNMITPVNGKIWMWMDSGGLALFPFDGKKCDAILSAFRLMLSRKIFNIEQSMFNTALSYRIVIHIGNTIFESEGNTGTLVSDAINSVFHLGQKFAEAGNLYLTGEAYEFTMDNLKNYFLPLGEYEGRSIYRMRCPL